MVWSLFVFYSIKLKVRASNLYNVAGRVEVKSDGLDCAFVVLFVCLFVFVCLFLFFQS